MSSLARPIANRAVHLRITPRPSSLGESREVHRLISQFGEIEYYKNLKYDVLTAPNVTIVIFKENEAAQHCMRSGPIRFRMGRKQVIEKANKEVSEVEWRGDKGRVEEGWRPAASAVSPNQTREMSTTARRASDSTAQAFRDDPPGTRIFQIQTTAARMHFRDQINVSHFHGAFKVDTKSAAQNDLAKQVPVLGMSDLNWRAADKPWDIMRKEKERDGAFRGSGPRKGLGELFEEAKGKGDIPKLEERGREGRKTGWGGLHGRGSGFLDGGMVFPSDLGKRAGDGGEEQVEVGALEPVARPLAPLRNG